MSDTPADALPTIDSFKRTATKELDATLATCLMTYEHAQELGAHLAVKHAPEDHEVALAIVAADGDRTNKVVHPDFLRRFIKSRSITIGPGMRDPKDFEQVPSVGELSRAVIGSEIVSSLSEHVYQAYHNLDVEFVGKRSRADMDKAVLTHLVSEGSVDSVDQVMEAANLTVEQATACLDRLVERGHADRQPATKRGYYGAFGRFVVTDLGRQRHVAQQRVSITPSQRVRLNRGDYNLGH